MVFMFLHSSIVLAFWLLRCVPAVHSFAIPVQNNLLTVWRRVQDLQRQPHLLKAVGTTNSGGSHAISTLQQSFDEIVLSRTACKIFQRYESHDTKNDATTDAITSSLANPRVVQQAYDCLQLAQHAPTSFNTQPYKIILVHSQDIKQKMSRFALGPNAKRVVDSDCTAVFCADRQVMRTIPAFFRFLNQIDMDKRNQPTPKLIQLKNLLYITLFSSGYPLPRIIAAPMSFIIRTILSVVGFCTRHLRIYVLPSFSSAETWATKQCGLVAMTYMLACSSRGLATSPMEGINAAGIRRVLKIPRRYAIPLIVATGIAKQNEHQQQVTTDAASTTSDNSPSSVQNPTPRYPAKDVIFFNQFGGGSTASAADQGETAGEN
jgi:nitroreductase